VPSLNAARCLSEPSRAPRARRALTCLLLLLSLGGLVSCKRKVSEKQCDELLDRFAELVVKERFPDAGPDVIAAERQRERGEAKGDQLRNCTSEVQADEHACAMKAASSEAIIKCLE
jgi:hypothetical protein